MGETIGLVKLDELQSSYEYLRSTETRFKSTMDAFVNMNIEDLKASLLGWAAQGLPDSYELLRVNVPFVPVDCSDGQRRLTIEEYIIFTCNKTLYDYLQSLQNRLVGIQATFVVKENQLCFLVSKQLA
jgi:uncharacterized protein YfaP (DUF2135 family)